MEDKPDSALFVLATIFIDAMGFGLIMPVLPRLLMRVGGLDLADAIEAGAWIGLGMAVASFFSAPVLGNLSDRFGRRAVLLIALAGMAISYFVLAIAGSIAVVVCARVLTGVFGSSYAPAQAAMADLTAPADRARNFGYVGAAFGVGFVLGPALGGLLAGWGDTAPFFAACGLAAANFLYGLAVFPETLPKERRRAFSWQRANPLGGLATARANPALMNAAIVLSLWQIASLVYPTTWSFFTIAQYGWSDAMIGASLAAVGLTMAVSQTMFTGPVVRRLGERDAASIGLVGAIAGFVAYAFSTQTWMAFALMIAIAFQSLVQPSLMAMLSREASPDTQGEVQGIAAMSMGIGAMIAPVALAWPQAYFTRETAIVRFPGAAFLIAAGFALVALYSLRRRPKPHDR